MAWENSDRLEHLPADWKKRRRDRFRRDGYQCTYRDEFGERCNSPAEECDHIGSRDDHRIEMLRSLCSYHHGKKSGSQGGSASARARRSRTKKFDRTETHPALMV